MRSWSNIRHLARALTRPFAAQVHASAGLAAPVHAGFMAGCALASGAAWLVLSAHFATATTPMPGFVPDDAIVTGSIVQAGHPSGLWMTGAAAFAPLALALLVSRTGRLRLASWLAAAGAIGLAGLGIGPFAAAIVASGLVGAAAVHALHARGTDDVDATALVTQHDSNGETLAVSPAFAVLLGCTPTDLLGGGLFARVHVQDRVAFRKALDDAAVKGRGACEFRLTGSDIALAMDCTSSGSRSGSGIAATLLDVTPARHESDATERARAEAEELSRAKSRFIAVASHELRTPLNAIIGFSDLLRTLDRADAALPHARRQEYAGLIHGAGQHLLEVVNDLLDMSRIEAGRYELVIDRVDMRETIERCLSMLSEMAAERDVRLVNIADRVLPPLEADPRACRQMLINLVSNALKFAPAGSTVRVGASVAEGAGSRGNAMRLTVCDRGDGMCAEDVARLGIPFTQVGSAAGHGRAVEGTGLGLSIVKGLVELHGGTFDVRSVPAPAPGHGTEVWLTLPLAHVPPVERPCVVTLPTPARDERAANNGAARPEIRSNEYGRVSA